MPKSPAPGAAAAIAALVIASAGPTASESVAQAALGASAPEFALEDTDGDTVKLSDFRGRPVVLEWFNPECPFVRYAHTRGPLAKMGNEAAGDGVVWLAINSGPPDKQGHGAELNRSVRERYGMRYPVLLDPSGEVGRAYRARTTPHLFVIDSAGVLVYRGALDNAPLGDVTGDTTVNYVEQALTALARGAAVATPETRPYGCSVKYDRR